MQGHKKFDKEAVCGANLHGFVEIPIFDLKPFMKHFKGVCHLFVHFWHESYYCPMTSKICKMHSF